MENEKAHFAKYFITMLTNLSNMDLQMISFNNLKRTCKSNLGVRKNSSHFHSLGHKNPKVRYKLLVQLAVIKIP